MFYCSTLSVIGCLSIHVRSGTVLRLTTWVRIENCGHWQWIFFLIAEYSERTRIEWMWIHTSENDNIIFLSTRIPWRVGFGKGPDRICVKELFKKEKIDFPKDVGFPFFRFFPNQNRKRTVIMYTVHIPVRHPMAYLRVEEGEEMDTSPLNLFFLSCIQL